MAFATVLRTARVFGLPFGPMRVKRNLGVAAARDIWVTSTALSTALNTAYFAESVATFAIVMGVALLLSGIGFLILTLRVLREPTSETEIAKTTAPRRQAVTA